MNSNVFILMADSRESPNIITEIENVPNFKYHEMGVGLFEASFRFSNIMNVIKEEKARVLLLGTAGSKSLDDVGSLSLSHQYHILPGIGEEIPDLVLKQWENETWLDSSKLGFLNQKIYASFGISIESNNYPENINSWENMEASIISYLCYKNQIPFQALLYCTNQIGPRGRIQWRENFQEASNSLHKAFFRVFTEKLSRT